MAITRRNAMARLTALASLLLPAGAAQARTPAARYVAALSDRASARRIGRAYLAAYPAEADAPRLTAQLAQALGAARGRRDLRLALRRAVRDDMRHGRSVLVDGWVLARTEARLCALASLT